MISISRKFFWKTANVVLEDDKVDALVNSGEYSSVRFMSYDKKDVPGFERTMKTTALIDLSPSPEEILKSFNDTTRNEIRRTQALDGFTLKVFDAPDGESYALYRHFEFSQGRAPQSVRGLGACRAFLAYFKGELISGIYVTEGGKYLRIRSIFSKRLKTEDRELYRIIGYATRRLVYEICLWGKLRGYVSLDLASVNLKNPQTASISRFKMSFNGRIVPEYTYIYKSKVFSSLEFLAAFKVRLRKIFHI